MWSWKTRLRGTAILQIFRFAVTSGLGQKRRFLHHQGIWTTDFITSEIDFFSRSLTFSVTERAATFVVLQKEASTWWYVHQLQLGKGAAKILIVFTCCPKKVLDRAAVVRWSNAPIVHNRFYFPISRCRPTEVAIATTGAKRHWKMPGLVTRFVLSKKTVLVGRRASIISLRHFQFRRGAARWKHALICEQLRGRSYHLHKRLPAKIFILREPLILRT